MGSKVSSQSADNGSKCTRDAASSMQALVVGSEELLGDVIEAY